MTYELKNGKVLYLDEEVVPAGKRAGGASVTSTSVTLPVIPELYRTGLSRVTQASVRRYYNACRRVSNDPKKASREVGADGVILEELVVQELLWGRLRMTML